MGLKLKISSGYFLLILVLASIIYLYHEKEIRKDALRKEENELADLHNLSQRVYMYLLDLFSQSEVAVAWTEDDFADYCIKLDDFHETLKTLKGRIHTSQQQARVDTFALLLNEKKQLLATIMITFDELSEVSEIVSEQIPVIVSQVRRGRTVPVQPTQTNDTVVKSKPIQQEKRKSIWNVFRRKENKSAYLTQKEQAVIEPKNEIKETRQEKDIKNVRLPIAVPLLQNLSREVTERQKIQRERLLLQMDSLYKNNQLLSIRLNTLISDFEREANLHLLFRYEALQKSREQSSNIIAGLAAFVFFLAVVLYIIVHRDINKRNRYQKALMVADEKSKELLQLRKNMMLTISHDIRGPLNTIICSAELATDIREKKKRNRHLEHIKDSGNYILSLVNNLLDMYRLNESKETRNDIPFQLNNLLERIVTGFTLQANDKGLIFNTDFTNIDVTVRGDADRIEQIADNLLTNAIKFTTSGTVGCKANYMNSKLTLEISDTGIGMDSEVVERIFTPFERVASSMNVEGFGLGLSITKGLVSLLEGTIRVTSTPGKGSCFTVTLPLPETSEKIEEEMNVSLSSGRLPRRVLVIDDDPMQLEVTKEIMERNGITCQACHYAKDVVNELRKAQYDLLLTDMQMPGINGLELLQLLRTSNIGDSKSIPIAAMTARGDKDKDSFVEAGFIGCIHKPFSTKELLCFLSTLMTEKRKNRNHYPKFSALTAEVRGKREMLQLFIQESEENVFALEKALQNNDYKRMRETVHRMMPIWELLQVDEILHSYQSVLHNETILPDTIYRQTKQIASYIRELITEAKDEIAIMDDETENIDSRG